MDKISWFNDVYSDMFSLEFDNLFNTIDFESFESKENDSGRELTIIQVQRVSDLHSQRQLWKQTTYQRRTSPGFF